MKSKDMWLALVVLGIIAVAGVMVYNNEKQPLEEEPQVLTVPDEQPLPIHKWEVEEGKDKG